MIVSDFVTDDDSARTSAKTSILIVLTIITSTW